MAVEARHLNLFPPQILSNREFAMMNGVEGNTGSVFGAPIGYGYELVAPPTETAVPMYGESTIAGSNFPAAAMKCDSGLTYASVSRKRSREAINSLQLSSSSNSNRSGGGFTFLGEDISFQIQHQQFEIDRFIAHHSEKLRMEIEERRKRYSRRIAAAVEESVGKKLKAREEEIQKMGKLNRALEERVKSLCVENQIWRDLAESNEAAANALRSNLQQVLLEDERRAADDGGGSSSSSCCGSTSAAARNACRRCEREESCVLLLPCRHLCLCTKCGSTLHTCPVCNATKTASVHVNLSFN